MINRNMRQSLPVIVDTPTSTPRLGFENYISGVSAAIMGGTPARYTVGLYGPWGSGKSSLLAAIRRELNAWPAVPPSNPTTVSPLPGKDAPIVVDFDAWRYADKGSLVVSMLLRIRAAVQLRTEQVSNTPEVQKKLLKALKVLSTVLQSIEVSAWGVSVTANTSGGYFAPAQDLAKTLMPFEQLEEIGEALPVNQRIVVLVDDLDRCSPAGVVGVVEAIHVLTDITGIVFVLALDYEYLTSAIRSAYPTTDPDRFIEKIVQVPFHVPAPKIEAAEMEHIIPTWAAIRPWVNGVDTEEIRSIMRIGLRSNPRQIKRLFNTFLLFAHMNDKKNINRALALKVLGLQVAWPAAFAELLRELATEFNKSPQDLPSDWTKIGKLETYSGWYAADDSSSVDGEEDGEIYSHLAEAPGTGHSASSRSDTHRISEGTKNYSRESLERLRLYLVEVLKQDIPPTDVWNIMVMAQDLVKSDGEESETDNQSITTLQETRSKAEQPVRDRFDEIVTFAKGLPESNSIETPQYYRISRQINDKLRVFAMMRVRPTQGTVRLQIRFGTANMDSIQGQDFPASFQKTVELKNGQMEGTFVVRDVQTVGVNPALERILRFAHKNVKP